MSDTADRFAGLSPAKRLLLQKLRREQAEPAARPIARRAEAGPAPLSFAQQRLWFIHQMDPESAAYNLAYPLRLRGTLDVGVLERSLDDLVARHETLRTVFPAQGGEPVQTVLAPSPQRIAVADLRRLDGEPREAAARALVAEETRRPFDLAAGPLLRVLLARLGDGEWVLCFTLHHVVGDGWSMGVLTREVNELYRAHSAGEPPRLPELPVQYADYAAWQRRALAGSLHEQVGWWRERLADAPPVLELPTDHPRRAAGAAPAGVHAFSLSADTSRALRELARGEGATPFMALLAAWQLLLARWSGQHDVSVGTAVAGRTRRETEGLIGIFVNTLVLRTDLSGDPSFRELLGRAREATLGAFAHQDVPFERLVEELAPERSLAHTPLFQVMFAMQTAERGELRLGALALEPLPGGAPVALFDLSLDVADGPRGIAGALTFRADLFEPATIGRMAGHFLRLAEAAASDPDRPLSGVSLLGADERRLLLEEWNVPRAFPADRPAARLFAEQALRTPRAAAVSAGDCELTYAEMDARSGRLARTLRALGVGPEVPVGVCLEHGDEQLRVRAAGPGAPRRAPALDAGGLRLRGARRRRADTGAGAGVRGRDRRDRRDPPPP
ncbi:MAG TPA: condensation domain-containing protein, partial [Longimicrobiaceae bacterium]|nr:condensation domain-containing protein [Longimicrobiaceae bacterium]